MNKKGKIILLSYFFAYCAVLQTIMYGTAWVGLMLARNEPPQATVFLRYLIIYIFKNDKKGVKYLKLE